MRFGVKNGPPTYQRAITKTFHEYIGVFMKIFLDDFIIFNDLSTNLEKLRKCFLKCREFGISLNPNKRAFMVFLRTILGFIVSKKWKFMDPKKVQALVNMPIPTTPSTSKFSLGWHSFSSVLSKTLLLLCHQLLDCSRSLKFLNGLKNVR
jgi:hypothetical protein